MQQDFFGSAHELLAQWQSYRWLLHPILPLGGRAILYAKRGVGKSQLALAMALCVLQEGRLFGRYRAEKHGTVLYVQVDLPIIMQQERLRHVQGIYPQLADLNFWMPSYLDVTTLHEDSRTVETLRKSAPCFVIWDILRHIHPLEDSDLAAALVYRRSVELFPGAAHLYIHHDKKTIPEQDLLDPTESFSGSGFWLNSVLTGMHLEKESDERMKLTFTKNNTCGAQGQIALRRDAQTLLPFLLMGSLAEEAQRWRSEHRANQRTLSAVEKARLKQHLLASFISPSATVESYMGTVK